MSAGSPGASAIGDALSSLSFETIEMLQTFRSEKSFLATAVALGRDERAVSRRLLELHETFEANFKVGLLERAVGRRGYSLTKAGESLAAGLEPVAERAWQAIESVQRASSVLGIPCSSTCLRHFEQLQPRLADAGLSAFTDPRRSADFPAPPEWFERTLLEGGEYRLAMYSTVVRDHGYELGSVVDTAGGLKVLVLNIEEFHLLAPAFLELPKTVSFSRLLDDGVSLWIPPGGAVMEFTQRLETNWQRRRPTQFLRTPDLDFGLQCLRRSIEPRRAAMIVHGKVGETNSAEPSPGPFGEEALTYSKLNRHQVKSPGEGNLVALTGLFYNKGVDMSEGEAAIWDRAWTIAQEVLGS